MFEKIKDGIAAISGAIVLIVLGILSSFDTFWNYLKDIHPAWRTITLIGLTLLIGYSWFSYFRKRFLKEKLRLRIAIAYIEFSQDLTCGTVTFPLLIEGSAVLGKRMVVKHIRAKIRLRSLGIDFEFEKTNPQTGISRDGDLYLNGDFKVTRTDEVDCIRNSDAFPHLTLEVCQVETNIGDLHCTDSLPIAFLPGKVARIESSFQI